VLAKDDDDDDDDDDVNVASNLQPQRAELRRIDKQYKPSLKHRKNRQNAVFLDGVVRQ